MKKQDRDHIIKIYDISFEKFGDRPEAVHWRESTQKARFEALTDIKDIGTSAIVDVGCGKGDLYAFLKGRGFKGKYIGLDINKNLIDFARKKFKGVKFLNKDITKDDCKIKADYIIISGMFNNRISDNDTFIKKTLLKIAKYAKKGIAFNLITDYVNFKEKEMHYASPEKIFGFCKTRLSRYVRLKHDYLPFDFTVHVFFKKDGRYAA